MTMTIIYADDYSMTVDHQLVIGDGDNGTTITEMAKMMIGVKNNWFLSKNFKPVSLHTLYFDSRPTVSTFYILYFTRSLGALRAPTSSWRPFGPIDFVLRALWALRPCDPRHSDWIVC